MEFQFNVKVHVTGLEGLIALLGKYVAPANNGAMEAHAVPMNVNVQAAPVSAPVAPMAPAVQAAPVAAPGVYAAPVGQQPGVTYAAPAPAPVAPSPVPTTAQTYTQEQLAVAATQLMDAGRQPELLNLLASFGVQAMIQLPKEAYGAFATHLRALGVKI